MILPLRHRRAVFRTRSVCRLWRLRSMRNNGPVQAGGGAAFKRVELWAHVGVLAACPKISHQSVERLAVGVMILPAAKIADVARPADVGRPGLMCFHYLAIESNWEQHSLVFARLTFEGRFDFLLHPNAADGVRRKDEHKFLVP